MSQKGKSKQNKKNTVFKEQKLSLRGIVKKKKKIAAVPSFMPLLF
jgi:hypothetical protein